MLCLLVTNSLRENASKRHTASGKTFGLSFNLPVAFRAVLAWADVVTTNFIFAASLGNLARLVKLHTKLLLMVMIILLLNNEQARQIRKNNSINRTILGVVESTCDDSLLPL